MAVSEEEVMDEVGSVPVGVEIDWTPENEVHLFYAMRGHKPVGIGKYFQMACIVEKFRNFANKDVTSKPLWEHLESIYDMQSLDDIENMPFPNEETDFCLPEEEFGNLMLERTKSEKRQVETSEEEPTPTTPVSSKPTKEAIVKTSPVKKEVNKEGKKSGNKESKEIKKEVKGKDVPKEGKKDTAETKEPKTPKQRGGAKEKEEEAAAAPSPARKKEPSDTKRGAKRPGRGGNKSDDASSNQSSSPVATPPPPPLPPQKRRRT